MASSPSTLAELAAAKAKEKKARTTENKGQHKVVRSAKKSTEVKATKKVAAEKKVNPDTEKNNATAVKLLHDLNNAGKYKTPEEGKADHCATKLTNIIKGWPLGDTLLQRFAYYRLGYPQSVIRESFRVAYDVEAYRSMSIWGDETVAREALAASLKKIGY
jgi:hypothetical protein